ncbi:DUF4907 domain-containing protein [Dyadobacter sp. Leaf189]|uniref:DUF4907 domain-containing protein n=1 Tax=Dyadobacter sp. Leaf189 TaxID=1736295 RepID=UPI0006FA10A5|nr:DUF4907 domain-containing protein [Dyadobacter sp. Leaf189]KQS27945.1 hypothetical protein ASG33_16210 [Dyadobacter sp. Leaf189]
MPHLLLLVSLLFFGLPRNFHNYNDHDGRIYSYKILKNGDQTFGYDVYADGKLLVHQPNVPALPGNRGFVSRESAEIVARLVLRKLLNGDKLPTVSIDEMRKLNAI